MRCHVGDIPRQNPKTTKNAKVAMVTTTSMSLKSPYSILHPCSKVTFCSFKCHWRGALGAAVSSIKLLPICTSNTGKAGWKSTGADPRNTTCCSILCGMGDCNLAHVRAMQEVDVKGLVCKDRWVYNQEFPQKKVSSLRECM